jgi:hypothetical protein
MFIIILYALYYNVSNLDGVKGSWFSTHLAIISQNLCCTFHKAQKFMKTSRDEICMPATGKTPQTRSSNLCHVHFLSGWQSFEAGTHG